MNVPSGGGSSVAYCARSTTVLANVASFAVFAPGVCRHAWALTEYSFFSNDPSAFLNSVATNASVALGSSSAERHIAAPSATSEAELVCVLEPRARVRTARSTLPGTPVMFASDTSNLRRRGREREEVRRARRSERDERETREAGAVSRVFT